MADEDVLIRLNLIIGLLVVLLGIQMVLVFPLSVLAIVIALAVLFLPGLILLLD
ncbi:hypothetical protein [Natronococcus sp. A-GB7]|uniref:hypothetical protein n=1 Tax=Natronococcus sp. A-GB7 TaxID=3037649 RepID=UPI00241DB4B4|nr:hypothetical protein [Natronococcus sp. A-GB7]MDG5820389.1 hypothetical protein [Natronococcus sp. A-GB7]